MSNNNVFQAVSRRSALKAGGLAGVTGLTGCLGTTPLGDDNDTIQMGGTLPLTGGVANPAQWIERAWNLKVDQINEDGGLLGRDVELTVYDNELDQEKMRSLTQRLINQDDIDVFIGPYATITMPVVSPVLEQNGYTAIHLFSPRSHLLDRQEDKDKFSKQFVFTCAMVAYPDTFVNFLDSRDDPPTTIAMAGRNDLIGQDCYESFQTSIEDADADFEIVANEYFDPEATSLSNVARKLKSADADLVAINAYDAGSQLFMEGAADVDLRPNYGFWSLLGPQVPEWVPSMGSTGNYAFGSTPYSHTLPTDANEDLTAIAQEEYGENPHYSYGFGYIQMQIYEQALREAGEVDQDALAEQLSSMTFDTVSGDLDFADTNFADAPMFVTQVQDDEIPVVYPDDMASTEPVAPLPDEWPDG